MLRTPDGEANQREEHEALDERIGRQREALRVVFRSVYTQDLLL